ncbi:branched-subunit amino acid transport protein AzlD [Bisgaardia hudsonensis]|uniref:Branched-subunit amino acid transport protein AzlD n=1 Tax=Bisgaardia hudsonensis TaxID=109472 RepID=A0A4R2N3B6_9PAST|nr:branched-chain amino acid transporter permease [Bisgaardia hudsonensis]QLB12829.1 branched-chain amino acid ABC transporter [Bisgaardia hudsonensis]TCP14388.1 branched-subunit amino acid transport protein AzlD [Bisgaardia hudsonensis]
MTLIEQCLTVGVAILAVQLSRLLPFWLFPPHRPIPEYIRYLGKVLPATMFGMLVVYCYKNVDFSDGYRILPEFIAGTVVVVLHFWKKNMFLSMLLGTGLYMYLVQVVFA